MKKTTTILCLLLISSTVFAAEPTVNGCSQLAFQAAEAIAVLNGATSVVQTNKNMVIPIKVDNGFKYTYRMSSYNVEAKLIENEGLIAQVLMLEDGTCKVLSVSKTND